MNPPVDGLRLVHSLLEPIHDVLRRSRDNEGFADEDVAFFAHTDSSFGDPIQFLQTVADP
jgi:hypothetical protein